MQSKEKTMTVDNVFRPLPGEGTDCVGKYFGHGILLKKKMKSLNKETPNLL